jgi:hypothetical protein
VLLGLVAGMLASAILVLLERLPRLAALVVAYATCSDASGARRVPRSLDRGGRSALTFAEIEAGQRALERYGGDPLAALAGGDATGRGCPGETPGGSRSPRCSVKVTDNGATEATCPACGAQVERSATAAGSPAEKTARARPAAASTDRDDQNFPIFARADS